MRTTFIFCLLLLVHASRGFWPFESESEESTQEHVVYEEIPEVPEKEVHIDAYLQEHGKPLIESYVRLRNAEKKRSLSGAAGTEVDEKKVQSTAQGIFGNVMQMDSLAEKRRYAMAWQHSLKRSAGHSDGGQSKKYNIINGKRT